VFFYIVPKVAAIFALFATFLITERRGTYTVNSGKYVVPSFKWCVLRLWSDDKTDLRSTSCLCPVLRLWSLMETELQIACKAYSIPLFEENFISGNLS